MLALVTNRDDLTADWLVLELDRRGTAFVRVNSEDFPEHARVVCTERSAVLDLGSSHVDSDALDAVWWRRSVAPRMDPRERSHGETQWAAAESFAAWEGFWATVDAHWVNHPAANRHAERKLLQLRQADRAGFMVPPTLITNDGAAVQRFVDSHPAVVCKALHAGTVLTGDHGASLYTQLVGDTAMQALATIGPEPYLFQALVPKRCDVRVTVIGDRVYACEIDSQSAPDGVVDWRAADLGDVPHSAVELPAKEAQRCLTLARRFDLRFAAIDLAVTPAGEHVFFEINPNGQWAWVEQLTGQPLACALADELVGAT